MLPPAVLSALILLVSPGCDTSVSPFAKTDRAFSVWGYLDARADTQRVRVEPVQDSALAGSGPFEARVTTENLATGETVTWQQAAPPIGEEVTAYTYWTTAPIEAEAAYRFAVRRPEDGATTTAEVSTPADFPPLRIFASLPQTETVTAEVEGVERLGAVAADLHYTVCVPKCQLVRDVLSYLPDATPTGAGAYRVRMYWLEDLKRIWGEETDIILHRFTLSVASVSED